MDNAGHHGPAEARRACRLVVDALPGTATVTLAAGKHALRAHSEAVGTLYLGDIVSPATSWKPRVRPAPTRSV
ncbi:MAG: hypothetical protein WD080_10570 [Egibacteraceae bacterium]